MLRCAFRFRLFSGPVVLDVKVWKDYCKIVPGEEDGIPKETKRSITSDFDFLLGSGVKGLASTIEFTSHAFNSSIRATEEAGSQLISSSSDLLKEFSPKLVESDAEILPKDLVGLFDSTTSISKQSTKQVRDGIGALTGIGAVVGASVIQYIPKMTNSKEEERSETIRALSVLTAVTSRAIQDTMESTTGTTKRLSLKGIDSMESVTSHVFGTQLGHVLGESLKTSVDIVDTFNSTKNLNLKKLSVKATKKAKDGLLSELARTEKEEERMIIEEIVKEKIEILVDKNLEISPPDDSDSEEEKAEILESLSSSEIKNKERSIELNLTKAAENVRAVKE